MGLLMIIMRLTNWNTFLIYNIYSNIKLQYLSLDNLKIVLFLGITLIQKCLDMI